MAAETLTVEQAVATIEAARQYEEPLRRRTEGVTWMLWGLVTAGLFASGTALGLVVGFSHPAIALYPFVWLAAGIAGTKAVWSIAGVSLPPTREGQRRSLLSILAAAAVVAVAWGVPSALLPEAALPPFALLGNAAPWVVLGLLNPHRATGVGRRAMVAAGAGIALVALVTSPLVANAGHAAWDIVTLLGIVAGGGGPFLAGLWQALRG
jgi:hypothetical protein